MSKLNEKTVKIVENDLNLLSLLETTSCLFRAYIIWFYIKLIRITKIDRFINLVKLFISNVKTKINNNYSQRKILLQWIQTKLKAPIFVDNFHEDWKNGIALCALMEGVVPGSCPRYDLLNPDNALDNLNLGLSLVKKHLNIDSPIESHEIHDCKEEAKLVYLLSRIKYESVKLFMKSLLKRPIILMKDSLGNNHKMFETLFGDEKACFAKGMGLILGVRTRRARFNIFCKPTSKLNLMIEISGPNTMCSEKISIFNPKKRVSADVVTSSVVADYLKSRRTTEIVLKIPLFYEVFHNRIVVTYIPLERGIHKLSIVWQGQHILNSPYTVKIEDCNTNQIRESEQTYSITSPTKIIPGLQWPLPPSARKDSVSLEDCATVVARKVLKQTIIINGRQHVIQYLESDSDKLNGNSYLREQNEFLEIYDKRLSAEIDSESKKLEKLLINDFNNSNLFDIKECDSLCSEKMGSNNEEKQNNQSSDRLDISPKIDLSKNEKFDDLSNSIPKRTQEIDLNDKTIDTNKQQIVSKALNYNNKNIIKNNRHRSYIPVKNMIQNWEMRLTKDTNELNEKKNKINSGLKTKIPCILVRNRREIFEKNNLSVSKSNSTKSNSTISSSSKDKNQLSLNSAINQNENIIQQNDKIEERIESIEEINMNLDSKQQKIISKFNTIENESALNTPDSGVFSSHVFSDTNKNNFNGKLFLKKSLSFPNLRRIDNQLKLDQNIDETENKTNDGTQTLSITGQYIDDEIPDYSNLFLGQYVSYTGLLNTETPLPFDKINFNNLFDNENNLNINKEQNFAKDLGIYPEKCEVFGAGAYYGQVGVKNNFVVSTKDSGRSYLAVGVQSTESDDVLEVSFTSIGQNRYKVQYEVSRPGYYVIFVKWGDYNIADSPFICKVTY